MLRSLGHTVLLHGRDPEKLHTIAQSLQSEADGQPIEQYVADLSRMSDVLSLANAVAENHQTLDALINNAGVFTVPESKTKEGLDIRFVVNTIAPYLLTKQLLSNMSGDGRVINLSSAAQSTVDFDAFLGKLSLSDSEAYAQSKLAIIMWSRDLARTLGDSGPSIIAINPGSFLGSKMVKEAYGREGKDLRIGAEILTRAVLDIEFSQSSGKYYDNDLGSFAGPHLDALVDQKNTNLVALMDSMLEELI